MYEVIAFIIAVTILALILAIIIKITGIIEKILKFTVILALPSKLLGMIVGIIQSIVIMYIILFIMSLPTLKMDFLKDSKYTNVILTKTPIISNITNDIVKSFNEIAELTKIKVDLKDADNTNGKIVDVLLKNNIVTIGNVDNLVESKKISIDNYLELKDKYKEEYND